MPFPSVKDPLSPVFAVSGENETPSCKPLNIGV